jgi:prepilin-type N-terminal cleavage/methylation domain-containing protein
METSASGKKPLYCFPPHEKNGPRRAVAASRLLIYQKQIAIVIPNHPFAMKNKKRHGFTLVEIMIVVAIIALLASIAVPGFLRARKRSQATRIINDLRLIDNALDLYAIENNKMSGAAANFTDLKVYMKKGSMLYTTGKDILGNDYGPTFSVDSIPKVPTTTFNALSDVAPPSFWSPYK